MDFKDITLLRLLELIEQDQSLTQRSISKALNISVGKANFLMKKLVSIKLIDTKIDKRKKVQYIITKKGIYEKSRLRHEYMKFSLQFYSYIKNKISEELDTLCDRNAHSIVIYGADELAELAVLLIQKTSLKLVGIIDPEKAGQSLLEVKIECPSKLEHLQYDALLFAKIVDQNILDKITGQFNIPMEKRVMLK